LSPGAVGAHQALRRHDIRPLEAVMHDGGLEKKIFRCERSAVLAFRNAPSLIADDDRAGVTERRVEVVSAEGTQIARGPFAICCGQGIPFVEFRGKESVPGCGIQPDELAITLLAKRAVRCTTDTRSGFLTAVVFSKNQIHHAA